MAADGWRVAGDGWFFDEIKKYYKYKFVRVNKLFFNRVAGSG